jgi:hypothetical protein
MRTISFLLPIAWNNANHFLPTSYSLQLITLRATHLHSGISTLLGLLHTHDADNTFLCKDGWLSMHYTVFCTGHVLTSSLKPISSTKTNGKHWTELNCLFVLSFLSSIWRIQKIWSVVDLLHQNPHWWSPIISFIYGLNLERRTFHKFYFLVLHPVARNITILNESTNFRNQIMCVLFIILHSTACFGP